MNLKEIMKEGPLTLAVGANDLMVFAKNLIYEAKRELEEAVIKKQSERYVSTKTACNILDVDECTLWRFGKKQLLFPLTSTQGHPKSFPKNFCRTAAR